MVANAGREARMDGRDAAEKTAEKFIIFRASEARDYAEHNLMSLDDLTPAIADGLAHFAQAGGGGQVVKLLFAAPGLSLSHVWFKSDYPLPLHSHSADCVYCILAGSLRVGDEWLGPGDGFFVGRDVPYTYTIGPQGVEVLEFRNTDRLNIRFMSRTRAFWDRAADVIRAQRDAWHNQPPPSAQRG
jgi:hypothetical protein